MLWWVESDYVMKFQFLYKCPFDQNNFAGNFAYETVCHWAQVANKGETV
jgi:hypothetical protein